MKFVDHYKLKIEKTGEMLVPCIFYISEEMAKKGLEQDSIKQLKNVATLPGIIKYALAMPDVHVGYGFPIGGVAAFDLDRGVISPGGVGYDINCGVRIIKTQLLYKNIADKIKDLVISLFHNIPSGVGSARKDFKLTNRELNDVLINGARWAVKSGFGGESDTSFIEDGGHIVGANPDFVTKKAKERGLPQLGTLGAGNHFVEIDVVREIFDQDVANAFGLYLGQIVLSIHTGSRGLGYQVCDDNILMMLSAAKKYGINLPDRQLCCAPISSQEGKMYFGAMVGAANYAFCNRQMLTHWARESFQKTLQMGPKDLGMSVLYDVAHNIAKIEKHDVDGRIMEVCVHRKGATRSLPAGHENVPQEYRAVGQPVLIPGSMGTCSYVLVGGKKALEESFGSTCHGAGRILSRHAAIDKSKGRDIVTELRNKKIFVLSASKMTIREEMPEAYKDVSAVVEIVHNLGLATKVVKLEPVGVIKG